MTDKTRPDRDPNAVENEGGYTAPRDDRKAVPGFMDTGKTQIDDLAQDVERAVDGERGADLRDAETEGLQKPRR